MDSARGFRYIRTFAKVYAWIYVPLSSKQLVCDLSRELMHAYPPVVAIDIDVRLACRIHESLVVDQRRIVRQDFRHIVAF